MHRHNKHTYLILLTVRAVQSRDCAAFFCLEWHKKNLTALEFWRNVYVCGVAVRKKISQNNSLWTSQR